MNIRVHYLSDCDGILTVGFYVHDRLVSIVAGECSFMENLLIKLREQIKGSVWE